jgi:hypothetical protein
MWPSVIESVSLNLLCFFSEFSAAMRGPLIPALTGIAIVALPPSMFVVIVAIAPNWLVCCQGGGCGV